MRVTAAVVTALIGPRHRTLLTPQHVQDGVDYVAFADKPLSHKVWQCRQVQQFLPDPCRDAKRYKILCLEHVPADVVVWVDAHCRFRCRPAFFVSKLYEHGADVVLFSHYRRCAYREAVHVIHRRKDCRRRVLAQMKRMRNEDKLPRNAGLFFGGCFAMRRTEAAQRFASEWWRLVETGSHRDQISLPVALKRSACRVVALGAADRKRCFAIGIHR